MAVKDRIRHAWNAIQESEKRPIFSDLGASYYGATAPQHRLRAINTSNLSGPKFSRIAIDASMVTLQHIKTDDAGDTRQSIDDGLNKCLNIEANLDQTGMSLIHDIVYSMFDEGVVAVVPIETTGNPTLSEQYDILSLRTGRIVQWYPNYVRVNVLDERMGVRKDIMVAKRNCAIIENPFYAVVNGNSTLQRLTKKLSQLDHMDDVIASGRLDLILQMPQLLKTDLAKESVKERINSLQEQLRNNNYGIAYVDATDKITQLNRPVTNGLIEQVKMLTDEFYNQLGLTSKVFDGTASETEMRTYYNGTIDVIITAIVKEFERKFLSKTARSQGHKIASYRDPFKLVPINDVAEIADKFTRNEILSPNEVRSIIGFGPSKDPKADELKNRNIAAANQEVGNNGSAVSPDNNQNDGQTNKEVTNGSSKETV